MRDLLFLAKATTVRDGLTKQYPRFEDWWTNAWSWRLARDPFTDATPLPGVHPEVWLQRTSPRHVNWGFPFTLTFLYNASDTEVNLIDIRFVAVVAPPIPE
jgi:hypothetical protein